MLLGHWIETKSVMGASRALEELAKLMPSEAHRIRPDGKTEDVAIEELQTGDKILVKPGEKYPADGIITEGQTSVNESMLTGESKLVSKAAGAKIIGGSINGEGSVTVEVKNTGKDSFLSGVIQLVKDAQADVGIAIGAGTDVAIETADIILVRSNPLDAVSILGLSRATYRKMLQNLAWATGYNLFAIPWLRESCIQSV